jgi:predicted phosphodiesterase
MSKDAPVRSAAWTAQQREMAVRMRAEHSVSEIAKQVNKTPKAVERFFERIGLTKDEAVEQELSRTTKVNPRTRLKGAFTNLQTTWGEPMMVRRLEIEFGAATDLVPVAIIPDIHAGMEDMKAIELACQIVKAAGPVALIYLGDNVDVTQLSSFDTVPSRIIALQDEIDKFHEIDRMFAEAAGLSTRRYWIMGNHEDRCYRVACANPKLSSLRGMQMDAMYGLDQNWKVLPNLQMVEDDITWRKKFLFKHGNKVRGRSSYTARAEIDADGMSGISGHTHRMGAYYETKREKAYSWHENGCLCSLDPDYGRARFLSVGITHACSTDRSSRLSKWRSDHYSAQ